MKLITRFKDIDGNPTCVLPTSVFATVQKVNVKTGAKVTEVISPAGVSIVLDDPEGSFVKWLAESLE